MDYVTPAWLVTECGCVAHRQRPAARISGIRLHIGGTVFGECRDGGIWPDQSYPLLDVYVPACVFDGPQTIDHYKFIAWHATLDALAKRPDLDHVCPFCRRAYDGAEATA